MAPRPRWGSSNGVVQNLISLFVRLLWADPLRRLHGRGVQDLLLRRIGSSQVCAASGCRGNEAIPPSALPRVGALRGRALDGLGMVGWWSRRPFFLQVLLRGWVWLRMLLPVLRGRGEVRPRAAAGSAGVAGGIVVVVVVASASSTSSARVGGNSGRGGCNGVWCRRRSLLPLLLRVLVLVV